MEIKKGQIWRNVHGEVEIIEVADFTVTTQTAPHIVPWEMGKSVFLATHEFVRDPKPEIKVGDWVVSKQGGRPRQITSVVPQGTNGNVHLAAFGINESVGIRQFWSRYEPCDPPPLHKALRGLLDMFDSELWSGALPQSAVVSKAREVANLYKEGER